MNGTHGPLLSRHNAERSYLLHKAMSNIFFRMTRWVLLRFGGVQSFYSFFHEGTTLILVLFQINCNHEKKHVLSLNIDMAYS